MVRATGPYPCEWCPGTAVDRKSRIRNCAECQEKVNAVAAKALDMQVTSRLSDAQTAKMLDIGACVWRRVRVILEKDPSADAPARFLSPRHALLDEPAGEPEDSAGAGWDFRAACRKVEDPDIFFPLYRSDTSTIERAMKFCAACSVRVECLNRRAGADGVWGGVFFTRR